MPAIKLAQLQNRTFAEQNARLPALKAERTEWATELLERAQQRQHKKGQESSELMPGTLDLVVEPRRLEVESLS
jgi:hypothetical protein